MAYGRRRMNKRRDKRSFSRHAMRVNGKNARARPMRGGYRL